MLLTCPHTLFPTLHENLRVKTNWNIAWCVLFYKEIKLEWYPVCQQSKFLHTILTLCKLFTWRNTIGRAKKLFEPAVPRPKKYNLKIFWQVDLLSSIKWIILMKNVTQINCFRNIFQTLPGIWCYFCHCVNRMVTADWFLHFHLCLYWQKLYFKNIGEQSDITITGRSKNMFPVFLNHRSEAKNRDHWDRTVAVLGVSNFSDVIRGT